MAGYLVRRLQVVDPGGQHWGAVWICRRAVLTALRAARPADRLGALRRWLTRAERVLSDGGALRATRVLPNRRLIELEADGRTLDRLDRRLDEEV